ncbi:MAG: hypothetical protein IIT78_03315, partial [Mycoplasmataceae bacterium]|nr:hypothetical protein [Mycoplasmataceae bacterium]
MKNRTKKLFFTYIGVIVLAIITPITIVCGTSYHTNKIANSKQRTRTISRVSKVPNFVNASLYQNTNYGTTKITIPGCSGSTASSNITVSNSVNVPSSAISSFLNQLEINVYTFNNQIPLMNFSCKLSVTGTLRVNVQSYSSLVSGSPTLLNSFNFNNNLNYTATNFSYSNFGPAGQACTYNNAPLEVSGNMNFNGINSNGNLEFNLTGVELPMPCVYSGKSWPYNQFQDPSVTYSTNGNWILTLPFNMNTIYNNIQNAISNISLSYYEFKQQWKTGLINQINQKINGCIPSYMSNCFVSSSTVTTYGATGGQINTTVRYIDGEGKSIPWHFTTTVTMPAQPSDESAYNLFDNAFSQPITLFSNTSNVWDSNKYWNSSTVPVDISSKPKTSSYIKTNNNIYYNGNLSTSNSTWCTNKAILVNYINMIFSLVENEIKSKANTANPDPFSNNPISLSYSFITTQNETHEIQTKLTFNNNNFNNVSNINSNYKNSPWIFNTPVSLSLTTFYYSGSILNRINIQALPMPVAGSFQLEPDNGYLIKGSNQT